MENKLVVTTYTNDPNNPGYRRLASTLKAWRWNFQPIIGPYNGFTSKLKGVEDQLEYFKEQGFTHLLFTDAFDTVCCGPPSKVDKFLTDKILISCECACWPVPDLESKYPKVVASRWRYVNSGGYVGPIDLIKEMITGGEGDDQLWWTLKFLNEQNRIELDNTCKLFQSTAHTVQEWAPWNKTFEKLEDGCVLNKETGTTPMFFHGNGGDPKLLTWMEDHLKMEAI